MIARLWNKIVRRLALKHCDRVLMIARDLGLKSWVLHAIDGGLKYHDTSSEAARNKLRRLMGEGGPLASTHRRQANADWDWCPFCRGALDTGWECNDCGADLRPFAYPHGKAMECK